MHSRWRRSSISFFHEITSHWNMSNVENEKVCYIPASRIAVNIWFYIFYVLAMFTLLWQTKQEVDEEHWKKKFSFIIFEMRKFFFLCSFNYRHSKLYRGKLLCRVLILNWTMWNSRIWLWEERKFIIYLTSGGAIWGTAAEL